MITVCFLSSAMRCQPLSRALCEWSEKWTYLQLQPHWRD
ncbi:acetyltransferase [Vibrio sp. B1-2]|nr:acetyltransferase [Vibrio sp. B1-2]